MPGICDGRVVIITGAGRGLGREHALEFARQGARVVVNDVGAELDGTLRSSGPAGEVVDQIRALGGEAIANGDDISDYRGLPTRGRRGGSPLECARRGGQ
jgi:NAD(P)-dependent dehydrogenase (short-subunit alcohol dehydrogenase family)